MLINKKVVSITCIVVFGIVGTVWATITDDNIHGTLDSLNNGATNAFTEMNKKGLFFNDLANYVRFWAGNDVFDMGADDDLVYLGAGQDALTFGGSSDDKSGAITFDSAGSGLATAFSSSNAYVRVDTPDTAPAMKMKSKTVTIQSYGGDTVIQLGS